MIIGGYLIPTGPDERARQTAERQKRFEEALTRLNQIIRESPDVSLRDLYDGEYDTKFIEDIALVVRCAEEYVGEYGPFDVGSSLAGKRE